ncbi:MAG: hypothetical protein WBY38_05460, partial [Candidatus Acidiferrales bacterium]
LNVWRAVWPSHNGQLGFSFICHPERSEGPLFAVGALPVWGPVWRSQSETSFECVAARLALPIRPPAVFVYLSSRAQRGTSLRRGSFACLGAGLAQPDGICSKIIVGRGFSHDITAAKTMRL